MHSEKNKIISKLKRYLINDSKEQISIIYGGYGDFIALDFFLSEYEKNKITTVYQLGYRPELYQDFFLNYKNITNYRYFWDCLGSKDKTVQFRSCIIDYLKKNKYNVDFVNNVINKRKYRYKNAKNSYFINTKLSNITKFNLPNYYFVICPYTINATEKWNYRKLTNNEWKLILNYSKCFNIKAVVLGVDCDVPEHENLINLNNKTTIYDAIEITKKGLFYIGVDSMLSIIGAFDKKSLIKTRPNEGMATKNKTLYYPNDCNLVQNINKDNIKHLFKPFIKI